MDYIPLEVIIANGSNTEMGTIQKVIKKGLGVVFTLSSKEKYILRQDQKGTLHWSHIDLPDLKSSILSMRLVSGVPLWKTGAGKRRYSSGNWEKVIGSAAGKWVKFLDGITGFSG